MIVFSSRTITDRLESRILACLPWQEEPRPSGSFETINETITQNRHIGYSPKVCTSCYDDHKQRFCPFFNRCASWGALCGNLFCGCHGDVVYLLICIRSDFCGMCSGDDAVVLSGGFNDPLWCYHVNTLRGLKGGKPQFYYMSSINMLIITGNDL